MQEFQIRRIQSRKNVLKQISSLFTIKSHTSLCPTFLFLPLVIIATPSPDIVTIGAFYATLLSFDAVKGLLRGRKVPQNSPFVCIHKRFEKKTHPPRNAREKRPKRQSLLLSSALSVGFCSETRSKCPLFFRKPSFRTVLFGILSVKLVSVVTAYRAHLRHGRVVR